MTVPKSSFCCETGLALMSELDAYGAGIIGIASCETCAPCPPEADVPAIRMRN
jgi:hypothetical protein